MAPRASKRWSSVSRKMMLGLAAGSSGVEEGRSVQKASSGSASSSANPFFIAQGRGRLNDSQATPYFSDMLAFQVKAIPYANLLISLNFRPLCFSCFRVAGWEHPAARKEGQRRLRPRKRCPVIHLYPFRIRVYVAFSVRALEECGSFAVVDDDSLLWVIDERAPSKLHRNVGKDTAGG